jgi:hypothetical protein
VFDEHVELLKRTLVQQQVDPLARRQLALGVLRRNPTLTTAGSRLRTAPFKLVDDGL